MSTRVTVHQVHHDGAEDVVVAPRGRHEGSVYTGTVDGAVLRVRPHGSVEQVGSTGGRPLGLEIDPEGRLLVCDAHRGLLRMDPDTGAVERLLAEVDGTAMVFTNNAAIGSDGTTWFSDSSRHYGIERWKDDFVQDTRSGRLLSLAPDGTVTTVLDGLAFANGVALSADESFVVVAETRARTLVRRWLTGDRAGTRDLLAGDLPGYPDNIARGSDGLIWVSIASPVDPVVERLGSAPMWARKAVTRIPERLQPKPAHTCRVQAYDDEGRLVHDLDLDTPDFHMVTGVREHEGRVWLGSLHEPAVAVVDL
ncbi:SMP-30/gluconolactonase/LRE family protein [uncultured Nocardioides sp.]|uniref:SMP-30/gluconolactonase/LRE family protein n=1 Tax=uncultured Nocardioides sp. TaxID=198441 RepID=UPI00260A6BFA|nr:SMP-30/gluconolactonase/LRE family protein [uncultured Nocardioides sp.]